MPELPEVETIVRDLKKKVPGRTFFSVWTDFSKMIKEPRDFSLFKKEIKGKKIKRIWRRGKNIIFDLSGGFSLLIHQKLTGHLLFGKWKMVNDRWQPLKKGFLEEKVNTYIHLVFNLDNGQMLILSDLRKFAKVELLNEEKLKSELNLLGPEPLEKDFTFLKFKEILKGKRGRIKQVLMNQAVIAGIGNIYSDEILWKAKIHPFKEVNNLKEKELNRIYKAIKEILKRAIKMRGTSISDFRDTKGRPGFFNKARKVYQRRGEKCKRCGRIIKRIKIGARSAHFCLNCQRL